MNVYLFTISIFLILSSLLGGVIAKKLSSKLNYLLGFVAGLMLGAVAFDLLPEIFTIAKDGAGFLLPMVGFVLGFIGFHFLEKMASVHNENEKEYKQHTHQHTGKLSTIALLIHRFLDGLSIGVAFGLNSTLGFAISLAVIAHSLADGVNLVGLGKLYKQDKQLNLLLLISSLAPILGIILSAFIKLPELALAIYLAVFSGFLLYLSAADILPQAHRQKPQWSVFFLTLLGLAVMLVISLAT